MRLSAILLVGVGAALSCGCSERKPEGRSTEGKPAGAPDGSIRLTPQQVEANRIETKAALVREVAPTITALGRVRARSGAEARVFSPFSGRLMAGAHGLPRIGARVAAGQVVAEVVEQLPATDRVQMAATVAELETAAEQTKGEVEMRRTELERARRLFDAGAIALKQVQAAEFNLRQAEAKLAGATRQKAEYDAALSQSGSPRRTALRAPIFGTVIAVDLTPGEQIDTTRSLLTIVDLSRVWVEVAVHESTLPALRQVRFAEIVAPAAPGRPYHGTLVTIGGAIDPENRTATVIFSVDNPGGELKLEMTAEARIAAGAAARLPLIPATAVLYDQGEAFVYVEMSPGVYARRAVTLGDRRGDEVACSAGLRAGEKVVSVGAESIRNESLRGQIPNELEGDRR